MAQKIVIGSDHAGFAMKEHLKAWLVKAGHAIKDVGAYSQDSVDYPDIAQKAVAEILDGNAEKGVLVCGTGLGMCYAANRFKGIRAALCVNVETAILASSHNNANVLCLGGRMTRPEDAEKIAEAWLNTPFEGGRHQRRIDKIDTLTPAPLPKGEGSRNHK